VIVTALLFVYGNEVAAAVTAALMAALSFVVPLHLAPPAYAGLVILKTGPCAADSGLTPSPKTDALSTYSLFAG
jgi:hypothetical protein